MKYEDLTEEEKKDLKELLEELEENPGEPERRFKSN